MSTYSLASHPPHDWNNWKAPGEGDVRSSCPMLNVLANHGILPHNGKGITKDMAVEALTSSINLGSGVATIFALGAVKSNPDKLAGTFDLDQVSSHGYIEHDSSLSRGDANLGDHRNFNKEIWDKVMETYGDNEKTDFSLASKARYNRLLAAKKQHEEAGTDFQYTIKELVMSYGETALFLGILGDPAEGKIPVKYLKALFEEERMPVKEGWTKNKDPLTQWKMNHLMYSLIMANDQKADELKQVGVGTFTAVTSFASSMVGGRCNVM